MFGLNNLVSQIVQAHSRRPKGSQSGRGEKARQKISSAGERALLPLVFKNVFVAPFLPVRLTAPGSPRMAGLQRVNVVESGAICSKNGTFEYFDGTAWTPRLRYPTPIMVSVAT